MSEITLPYLVLSSNRRPVPPRTSRGGKDKALVPDKKDKKEKLSDHRRVEKPARRAKAVDSIVANLKATCEEQARSNEEKQLKAAKLQVKKAFEGTNHRDSVFKVYATFSQKIK